jgi:hypothetical protein
MSKVANTQSKPILPPDTPDARKAWFSSLKVGDRVLVEDSRLHGQPPRPTAIEHLNAAHITCADGTRFNRKTGRLVGGTSFHWADLRPWTEEAQRSYDEAVYRAKLARQIQHAAHRIVSRLTIDQCRTLVGWINATTPEQHKPTA